MRQLTQDELALLDESLDASGHKYSAHVDDKGKVNLVRKPKENTYMANLRSRLSFFGKPGFWAVVVMVISVSSIAMIYGLTYRIDEMFGQGALDTLTKSGSDKDVQKFADESGMGWIPSMLELYQSRGTIVLFILIVTIVIAGVLILWQIKLNKNTDVSYRNSASLTLAEAREEMERINEARRGSTPVPVDEIDDLEENDDTEEE